MKSKVNNKINNFETNEDINFKVEKLNINGEGLCNINGNKICVKGVLPNEEVKAKINYCKNKFISCNLTEIEVKSNKRITPPCPYYKDCGGCDFQFANTMDALTIKKEILQEYFKEIFMGEISIIPSENEFNYRNKASFYVKNGNIGFQKEGTNEIVCVNNCIILNPLINKTIPIFKEWLKSTKNESITHFVIRVLNEKLSIVVVTKNKVNNINSLVNGLKNEFLEGSFGLYVNVNNLNNKILSNKFSYIYGLKLLETSFENIKYYVHPNSFMQVNDEVKSKLYAKVLEYINNNDIVIEGYSGAGLLSALISTKAKYVYAVEINKNATEDAQKVKEQNNISNLENINGNCKEVLPLIIEKHQNATFVIDPARSGCDKETLNAVKQTNIQKIIYISCNPYTLKQNIVFLGNNYKIKNMYLFDMFPQTFHTETLTILERI